MSSSLWDFEANNEPFVPNQYLFNRKNKFGVRSTMLSGWMLGSRTQSVPLLPELQIRRNLYSELQRTSWVGIQIFLEMS